ncbi:PepSY domain-containing protein [Sphingobacterium shayense]|uniref:PepSY-associated TM helix domain-containing protein n=1 Tax=Sphingobacterium shayense TaxID=626343 RepID=UPI001553CB17|nr:PepSY-associated TM helix domain-containing protein [Sphingobacterium shayense]NQD69300.1 PepSY domain-containing protein [Sphingobacterium shayense]
MKKKNLLTKTVGKLHLILGLTVGAIVFIVALTGCLFAFQQDITDFLRRDVIYHKEAAVDKKKVLPLAELEARVKAFTQEPYEVFWVDIPLDKQKSYKFIYLEMDEHAWNYFDEFVSYKSVYINPYSGEVLRFIDEEYSFFHIVKYIHFSLLLKSTWGKWITGVPTLIFIFMLVSGLYLWWPKTRKSVRQRFWFRWKKVKGWKRKNYDLHNILGFYTIPFALVLAITGAFYSFLFIQGLLFSAFAQPGESYPFYTEYNRELDLENYEFSMLDKMSAQVAERYPTAAQYSIVFPYEHLEYEHPEHPYEAYVKQLDYSYHVSHRVMFDPNTAEIINIVNYDDKSLAEKVLDANYDIHVGAIGGMWGKILAFIISAICASLPVTGFMIWRGRQKKAKKLNRQPKTTALANKEALNI